MKQHACQSPARILASGVQQRAWAWLIAILFMMSAGCGAPSPISHEYLLEHTYSARSPQFVRTITSLLGPPVAEGNHVTTLVNGQEIFPAMLEAITGAKKTITLETYIYWSGDIGKQFTDALIERAQAGVAVHVIIDAVGSDRIDNDYVRQMEEAGIHVVRYNPVERVVLLITLGELNYRTHRKILVVDGRVGFIGGVGISDLWAGNARNPQEWRDNHYKVVGPAVAYLQGAFVDNWSETVGQVLDSEDYLPPLQNAGQMHGQVFMSSPAGGSASMELMFLLSINAAEDSIYIATPYFVPNDILIATLRQARERGVTVKIIVPGPHMDAQIVREASHARWDELLSVGVEIYEYQPTMYHCKLLVIDGIWTSVGSANVDPRSFRLNDEANLNIYNEPFAQVQMQLLEHDITHSRLITANKHNGRPLLKRIGEFFSTWLSPQL